MFAAGYVGFVCGDLLISVTSCLAGGLLLLRFVWWFVVCLPAGGLLVGVL